MIKRPGSVTRGLAVRADPGLTSHNEQGARKVMGGKQIRVTDCCAGALWVVAALLLVRSSTNTDLVIVHALAMVTMTGAAVATVCAVIQCAATKVLRAIHRAQLEELLKG